MLCQLQPHIQICSRRNTFFFLKRNISMNTSPIHRPGSLPGWEWGWVAVWPPWAPPSSWPTSRTSGFLLWWFWPTNENLKELKYKLMTSYFGILQYSTSTHRLQGSCHTSAVCRWTGASLVSRGGAGSSAHCLCLWEAGFLSNLPKHTNISLINIF